VGISLEQDRIVVTHHSVFESVFCRSALIVMTPRPATIAADFRIRCPRSGGEGGTSRTSAEYGRALCRASRSRGGAQARESARHEGCSLETASPSRLPPAGPATGNRALLRILLPLWLAVPRKFGRRGPVVRINTIPPYCCPGPGRGGQDLITDWSNPVAILRSPCGPPFFLFVRGLSRRRSAASRWRCCVQLSTKCLESSTAACAIILQVRR